MCMYFIDSAALYTDASAVCKVPHHLQLGVRASKGSQTTEFFENV